MESSKAQENRSFMSYKMDQGVDDDDDYDDDDDEEEEDSEYGELGFEEDDSKKKKGMTSSSSSTKKGSGLGRSDRPFCQSDNCNADLTVAKNYHRRHKVCEIHAKAPIVLIAGYQKRFCQQCSRFHGLVEFDETKKSCRKRLAGHNERRRKNMSDINIHGEGSID